MAPANHTQTTGLKQKYLKQKYLGISQHQNVLVNDTMGVWMTPRKSGPKPKSPTAARAFFRQVTLLQRSRANTLGGQGNSAPLPTFQLYPLPIVPAGHPPESVSETSELGSRGTGAGRGAGREDSLAEHQLTQG